MRHRFDQDMRRRHKWRNMLHSLLLLSGMGGLVALSAYGVLGFDGMLWTLLGGGAALMLLPRVEPRWVMRAYGARPLDERTFPQGIRLVRRLAARAGLETAPRLFYIPSRLLNTFATGTTDNPAIGITDGMLRQLDWRELAGVLAHEISHVGNNDLWLMGVADLLSRLTSALSYLGMILLLAAVVLIPAGHAPIPFWAALLMIVAPTFGSLLQLAFSRAREYDADLDAATLTGDPQGLASALAKLQRIPRDAIGKTSSCRAGGSPTRRCCAATRRPSNGSPACCR